MLLQKKVSNDLTIKEPLFYETVFFRGLGPGGVWGGRTPPRIRDLYSKKFLKIFSYLFGPPQNKNRSVAPGLFDGFLIVSTSKVPLLSSLETHCLLKRVAPGVFIAVKLLYFQNAKLIGLFYSLFDSLNYCRRQAELYCCIHDKLCPETDPGYRC